MICSLYLGLSTYKHYGRIRKNIISLNIFLSQWFVGIKYHSVFRLVNIGAEMLLFIPPTKSLGSKHQCRNLVDVVRHLHIGLVVHHHTFSPLIIT